MEIRDSEERGPEGDVPPAPAAEDIAGGDERQNPPPIDWPRTGQAAASLITFLLVTLVAMPPLALALMFPLLLFGGYRLSRTSRASGYWGSALLGIAIGFVFFSALFALVGLIAAELSALIIYVALSALLGTVGGMIGWRRKERASARPSASADWSPQRFGPLFVVAGVVSLVLVAWLVLYGGLRASSLPALAATGGAPVLLLYPFYVVRLNRYASHAILHTLLPWSVSVASWAIVVAALCHELPKGGSFRG